MSTHDAWRRLSTFQSSPAILNESLANSRALQSPEVSLVALGLRLPCCLPGGSSSSLELARDWFARFFPLVPPLRCLVGLAPGVVQLDQSFHCVAQLGLGLGRYCGFTLFHPIVAG